MNDDTYLTVEGRSEGLFKDKGSRFIAMAFPVTSAGEVKDILATLRKEYHDARHHCYAYRLGPGGQEWRANDDGEPSGSAGKPILGQLQSFNVTNVLVVVVRYFGGILLGVGGLVNAYRTAARDCLENARIVSKTFNTTIELRFSYAVMNDVMRILKDNRAEITSQEFRDDCRMEVSVRSGSVPLLEEQLNRTEGIEAHLVQR